MPTIKCKEIEISLLVEAIYRYYGFDFRHYAPNSLKRRLLRQVKEEGLSTLSALQERVLHDEACMERLLLTLSINVTSMFRDPEFYQTLRMDVLPMLRTYPDVRVWVAGCSTGEEVYSIAIVLKEEGLYEKSRIYATDMNQVVLERAKKAVYPLDCMQEYTENYQNSGAKASFSDYYHASHDHAVFDSALRENVVFSQHNLATDTSFNEFQLILCRNVMIYFDKELQSRVVGLFKDSLCMFGVLGLGRQESLRFSDHEASFELLDIRNKFYRRIV
jgi:chemotaxis protein methyltransferase CheR